MCIAIALREALGRKKLPPVVPIAEKGVPMQVGCSDAEAPSVGEILLNLYSLVIASEAYIDEAYSSCPQYFMANRIITISYEIPGFSDLLESYRSEKSLLDADIILFESDFSPYDRDYPSTYSGKTVYSKDSSFQLREDTIHWQRELSMALQHGKTVFVIFGKYKECFLHTGQKTTSGTGRNAKTTNHVESYNNFKFLPVDLPSIIPGVGEEIVFKGTPEFATLWKELEDYIGYESYLDGHITYPTFVTKTGAKPVGGVFKVGKGHLVLLPPIRYSHDEFIYYKGEEVYWKKEAIQFGKRLVQLLVDIDKELIGAVGATPPPSWVAASQFRLKSESSLQQKISKISDKIEDLTDKRTTLSNELLSEQALKRLLYEKGKSLEAAVTDALQILGYSAKNYDDGELELDQVIMSPEGGRFIGECEGKDKAAVNIDKFRQLESNIQEDLEKDEISEAAIGILFGNGFRMTSPEEREPQFTEKCIKNARRLGTILITTPDLYRAAKYIKESGDSKFATECRRAITESRGALVEFPKMNAERKSTVSSNAK